MIREITQFIADQASLTCDEDIFAGHRPGGEQDNCDVVLETTGGSAFFDLPERADPVIQVLSRDMTYFKARARAYVIYDAIFRDHSPLDPNKAASAGWILPIIPGVGESYEAMVIEPLAPPQYIGQDVKNRYEFSTNYVFKTKRL